MGQKGIFDMVDYRLPILENDGNDVETGVAIQSMIENISVCGIYEFRLFCLSHCKIGLAIVVAFPRLHLHNDQLLAIFCDDINLLVPVTPIPFEDLVTLLHQELSRKFLALFAKFIMFRHNRFSILRSLQQAIH